ncbi:hypothetical protein BVRB_6g156320, partial [Beta vulgaris subsp. vulgaris]
MHSPFLSPATHPRRRSLTLAGDFRFSCDPRFLLIWSPKLHAKKLSSLSPAENSLLPLFHRRSLTLADDIASPANSTSSLALFSLTPTLLGACDSFSRKEGHSLLCSATSSALSLHCRVAAAWTELPSSVPPPT